MGGRFFDYDPFTGILEKFHYNEDDDTFLIEAIQDTTAIEEAAKTSFNSYDSPRDRWGDYQRVAHIPNVILQDLMLSGKLKDQAYMKRWLNDPDNAVFRTRPGRV
jgi:hypothetical protein